MLTFFNMVYGGKKKIGEAMVHGAAMHGEDKRLMKEQVISDRSPY